MKVYRGEHVNGETAVTVIDGEDNYPLKHHVRHSPDGFNWGYGGSGPSELARCILIDYLGEEAICTSCDDGKIPTEEGRETCWECGGEVFKLPVSYQDFKWQVIAGLKGDSFELTGEKIEEWRRAWTRARAGEAA